MLQIMIACKRTGQFVPAGIETDIDTFMALPEALSLTRCPACGGNHYWTRSQTWICNTESSLRAAACRCRRRPVTVVRGPIMHPRQGTAPRMPGGRRRPQHGRHLAPHRKSRAADAIDGGGSRG